MLGSRLLAALVRPFRALRAERCAPAPAGSDEPQASAAEDLAKARAEAILEAAAIVVDVAIAQWRITPALRGWAIDYAAHDPRGFAAFLVSSPVLPASALVPPRLGPMSPISPRVN